MAEESREREELSFLVGNSCSRAINLLMNPSGVGLELREELVFLSEKAARLAELIAEEQGAEGPEGQGLGTHGGTGSEAPGESGPGEAAGETAGEEPGQ
ncbi:MAG TPA: hypothetical protein VFE20_01935 [Thermoleophilia bacterium]|nr:hypothetical protein [Thermoleophilia bacterium]